jgi:hypothetical protein
LRDAGLRVECMEGGLISFSLMKGKGQKSVQRRIGLGKVPVAWPERLALLTRSNFEMSSWN